MINRYYVLINSIDDNLNVQKRFSHRQCPRSLQFTYIWSKFSLQAVLSLYLLTIRWELLCKQQPLSLSLFDSFLVKHPLWIHYVDPTWLQLTHFLSLSLSLSLHVWDCVIILTLENDAHPSPLWLLLLPVLPFVVVVLMNATSLLFVSWMLLFTLARSVRRWWRDRHFWCNWNLWQNMKEMIRIKKKKRGRVINYFTPSKIRIRQAEVKAMIKPRRIEKKVNVDVSVLERIWLSVGGDDVDWQVMERNNSGIVGGRGGGARR